MRMTVDHLIPESLGGPTEEEGGGRGARDLGQVADDVAVALKVLGAARSRCQGLHVCRVDRIA